MNKSYRSIWNASLGCYVAAPESATAHRAGTSCARSARRVAPTQACSAMVMEQRIVFDGAMLATVIDQGSDPAADTTGTDAGDNTAEVTAAPSTAATEATPATDDTPTTETQDAGSDAASDATSDTSTDAAQDSAAADASGAETTASDDVTPMTVDPVSTAAQEVVFVDSRVESPEAFAIDGREVVVLNADQDGMTQIADALSGRTGLTAIHIVSHGGDGYLSLGSDSVTAETIQSTQLTALQQIGQALSADGDILIYACDYAAGDAGLETMQLIADITGADVAASSDATGHETLGGDWVLEQSTGAIEAAALAPTDWVGGLDFTFTGAGTVGAVGMANNIMGAGVTVVSANYQGGGTQSGTFTSGSGVTFGSNVLGFTSGTILSTSTSATGVAGPNNNGGYGTDAPGVDGDAGLNALAGNPTFDAAILDISFIPDVPAGGSTGDTGRMTLEIVFGSEEYLEYVGQINDVMEVLVNGQLVSLVPNASGGESTIGINSINSTQNPSLFVNNTGATYNTQMDGFTHTVPLVFDVNVGQINTIRIAVADAYDSAFDSWLFIRADSGQTVVVAEDDSVTTAANQPITVDLTANDYNLSGADMTLTKIQGQTVTVGQQITLTSGVKLTVGAGGEVTVTGDGSNAAHDTFTYEISNGLGGIASATVDVNITAPNLYPPTAQNDAETVLANATHSDSVLVDNGFGADTDGNGDPLSVVQVNLTEFTPGSPITLASGAELTMNADGSYVYNPNGAFVSLAQGSTTTDSFSYTVTDGHGGNSTATVTITVQGVNDAPVAVDDAQTVDENQVAVLNGFLANDQDVDGDELSVVLDSTTGSQGGQLFTDDSGLFYFDAGSDFDDLAVGQSRNTSFTYTLYDAYGLSDTATVTITVQGANDAPVGADDHISVSEEGAYLVSVLDNDVDPEGDWLWMSLDHFSGSNGGRFEMDDSGFLVFIPGSDFDDLNIGESRQTSLSYFVSDEFGAISSATAYFTVTGANDAPEAHGDSFTAMEDGLTVLGSVVLNDSDVDDDVSTLNVLQGVFAGDNGGRFYFDDGGILIFDPMGDFDGLTSGQSSFTHFDYTVYDEHGASAGATVTVEVIGVNDAPLANDDQFATTQNAAIQLGSLTANDSDVDGNHLSAEVISAPSDGGQIQIDDSQNVFFTPGGDFDDLQAGQTRQTHVSYLVHDDQGGSSAGQVTITVTGVNDDPVGHDDAYETGSQTAAVLGRVTDNDTDVDGDELSMDPFAPVAGSNGGRFSIDDSGCLVFDPAGEFDDLAIDETRLTSYTYSVSDGHGGQSSATATVTVRGEAQPEPVVMAVADVPPSYPDEVVFVDARIPDPQAFALSGRELIVLNLQENGLDQIAAALSGRSGIEAIHIVSHGGDGYLTLGSGNIDANNIENTYYADVQTIGQALTANGDILIYACDFASGPDGQNAMQLLAQYSVADVAASLDTTGHSSLSGDWALEATVGTVETTPLAPVGWLYTLNLPASSADAPVTQAPVVDVLAPVALTGTDTAAISTPHVTPVLQGGHVALVETQPLETPAPAVRGFDAPGTVRVSALEAVFRQTLTPFLPTASTLAGATFGAEGPNLLWVAPSMDTTAPQHDEIAAWKPAPEGLDEALLDEQLAKALAADVETGDGEDVDALQSPQTLAAPGFAAQLARWNRWSTQRPVTRASARA